MRKLPLFLFALLLGLSPIVMFAGNGLAPANHHPIKAHLKSQDTVHQIAVDPLTEMEIAAFAATPAIHERQTHPGGIITLTLAIAGLFLFPIAMNALAPQIVRKLSTH